MQVKILPVRLTILKYLPMDSTETSISDSDGYYILGAGVNLNLRGKLTGTLQYIQTMDREDYEENTVSATLKLSF